MMSRWRSLKYNRNPHWRRVKLMWYWCFDKSKYWQYKHNPLPVWSYFDE